MYIIYRYTYIYILLHLPEESPSHASKEWQIYANIDDLFFAHKSQSLFFLDPVKPSLLLLQSPIDGSDADACLLVHGANDVTIRHQDHHMPSTLAGDLTSTPVVSSTKIMAYPRVN